MVLLWHWHIYTLHVISHLLPIRFWCQALGPSASPARVLTSQKPIFMFFFKIIFSWFTWKRCGNLQKSPWTSHYLKDVRWFSSDFQTWKRHLCDFCPAQVLPRLRAVMRTMSWKSLTCCRKSLQRRFSAGAKNPFSGRFLSMSLGGRCDWGWPGATWSNR